MRKQTYVIWLLAAALIMTLAGCGSNTTDQPPGYEINTGEETLKAFFLDAGKADAALIRIPGGHWVMIDTGLNKGFGETGRQLVLNGVDELSAVFLTHGHSDHIGGITNVLTIARCKKLYTNGDGMKENRVQQAADLTQLVQIKTGDVINIGEASFTVIGPVGSYSKENDNSLVIMLQYKDVKLLFAADQLSESENDILGLGDSLKADVLKVAHHGEDDSSSLEFIKAVSPRYAVIPTDLENPPSKSVLSNIAAAGAKAFVLGETGTMVFESDGKQSKISPLPAAEGAPADIRVDAFSSSAEYVKIKNYSGETVDLTGWHIYSDKGGQYYFFPKGTALSPGEGLTVYSADAAASRTDGLIWTTDKVWRKKDVCMLFDNWGRQVRPN